MKDASPKGRIVKTKSIPNVSDERLLNDIAVLHDRVHTADGLHAFSDTRRTLVDTGIKLLKIRDELIARNVPVPNPDCRFCGAGGTS
jgi:hypothetical protein